MSSYYFRCKFILAVSTILVIDSHSELEKDFIVQFGVLQDLNQVYNWPGSYDQTEPWEDFAKYRCWCMLIILAHTVLTFAN